MYLTDEETEAKTGYVTCSTNHKKFIEQLGPEASSPNY